MSVNNCAAKMAHVVDKPFPKNMSLRSTVKACYKGAGPNLIRKC